MARPSGRAAVRVIARVRPSISDKEVEGTRALAANAAGCATEISPPPHAIKVEAPHCFAFDGVLAAAAGQAQVYDLVAAPVVEEVLGGTPGTIFPLGESGAGKTHSLFGDLVGASAGAAWGAGTITPGAGLAIRVAAAVLAAVIDEGAGRTIWASAYELYLSTPADLLVGAQGAVNPADSAGAGIRGEDVQLSGQVASRTGGTGGGFAGLRIRSGPGSAAVEEGLATVPVRSLPHFCDVLSRVLRRHKTAGTHANDASSRSHIILTLGVEPPPSARSTASLPAAQLYIVDLVGVERLSTGGDQAVLAQEAMGKKRDILALTRALAAMRRPRYVPLRDRLMTRLLARVFSRMGLTVLLVCVSPSSTSASIMTMDHAARARGARARNPTQAAVAFVKQHSPVARLPRTALLASCAESSLSGPEVAPAGSCSVDTTGLAWTLRSPAAKTLPLVAVEGGEDGALPSLPDGEVRPPARTIPQSHRDLTCCNPSSYCKVSKLEKKRLRSEVKVCFERY